MNNAYIRAQQCKVKEAKFPFVKIGGQYWTTKNLSLAVTPKGNTIPEMQANGNVEKIANIADREFSSDTGFWYKENSTIVGGICNIKNSIGINSRIVKINTLTIGKLYKVSYSIVANRNGAIKFQDYVLGSSVGSHTSYIMATTVDNSIGRAEYASLTDIDIDNISVQEIGWSGSQELYDGIYAQTAGTVEQKTYAAVKAAAMWSNYNNDAPTGLIYGKLYNWFAVKLFQMDIDYYNAANPTKPYIWRIPTQAEFQTLSTYLGGDAVSGGKLKEAGLAHWNSPNTGADNSSGFCALGSGMRGADGVFIGFKTNSRMFAITEINSTTASRFIVDSAATGASNIQGVKVIGCSIRLIKA